MYLSLITRGTQDFNTWVREEVKPEISNLAWRVFLSAANRQVMLPVNGPTRKYSQGLIFVDPQSGASRRGCVINWCGDEMGQWGVPAAAQWDRWCLCSTRT